MSESNAARSELIALYLGLKSDANTSREKISPTMSGFWDRTYVRAVFAMFEGVTFATRQYILAQAAVGHYEITDQERALLSEQTFSLDSKGVIHGKESFLQFMPGFRLTMTVFGRCLGMSGYADSAFGHNGFESFREGVRVRNQVTHPKSQAQMMLSHKDIETVKLAERWFDSLFEAMLGSAFEPASQTGAT
ncbi:hypothetical protein I4I80_19960 [Pseudomonas syringae pv. tomato]|uniref:Uncharacterized protein n=1 Tax=Pseudomonas syringae pv. japonica str. M301072 TaxID=629262 RepID=F3FFJ1_PSESX|nr:hypothetical protein PSYJA_08348 [Pseudomonas syringae pv. japonica str. M301072]MBF9246377.1 hypothetical protein [Pseudomonas syringae pv. tomato]MBW8021666.1 hypothetical protein [Pseudomonas syringae pv. tomato]MEE5135579.1 hypothetical protein [Pseudomonas alliivorans]